MDFRSELEAIGLKTVTYKYDLSKEDLFHEAIQNDRGRVAKDGPSNAQKAYPTKLGVRGPLVYYTDPDCTGRRVKDTYAVAWPEVEETIWWKDDVQRYDPVKYQGLLQRVLDHLNAKKATLYVKDVYVGADPEFAIPYRFVGEFATHAMFAHNMFPKCLVGVKDVAKLCVRARARRFARRSGDHHRRAQQDLPRGGSRGLLRCRQEDDLHRGELLAAARRSLVDALLGQRRSER